MARKICPACKRMNAGSATACSCGHAFEASSIVAATRPTTRRCSQCKTENPRLLEICGCGHVFEEVRELREQLEDRVRVGWSLIALGVLVLGGFIAIVFIMSTKFVLGLIGGCVLLARGVVARGDARRYTLRSVADQGAAYRQAQIVGSGAASEVSAGTFRCGCASIKTLPIEARA